MSSDLARVLRLELADPVALCERLGLLGGRLVRQARGLLIACPWHDDRTPSCSVREGRDGTVSVRCHGCGETGDALSLVAVASGLDVRRDFRAVLGRAAELADRWDLVAELDAGRTPKVTPPARRELPRTPEPTYPPRAEVEALLAACVPVTWDADASVMLRMRGLDPTWIEGWGYAFAIPASAELPRWARFGGRPWTETGHRLVLPVVDASGDVRSVRAWRVVDGDTPKRVAPAGHKVAGLVLADEIAVAMLRETFRPRRVIVVEGEPDFLTATSVAWSRGDFPAARLGIASGAWTPEFAARIPDGAEVAVWTDDDDAGDRYASEVAGSLRARCRVVRGEVAA